MGKIVNIAYVFFLAFLLSLPLFRSGIFPMHDDTQVVRLYEMDKALKNGQFPVRWVSDLGYGFGYPMFNFYPPLAYYVGEAVHVLFKLTFIDSIKTVFVFSLVGSGIGMYLLGSRLFGSSTGLMLSALYMYAPYRAVDVYVRGALAESFSFIFLPFILLFIYLSNKERKTYHAIISGVFMSLLLITHQITFIIFVPLSILWGIFSVDIKIRVVLIKYIYSIFVSILVCLSIGAFFWIPAFFEKHLVMVDLIDLGNHFRFSDHFVCLKQLWNSPFGFGGSNVGCVDGFSFQVGKFNLVLLVVSGFVIMAKILVRQKFSRLLLGTFAASLVSLFMTNSLSEFVWSKTPLLPYVQFPWRFIGLIVLFTSLLAGWMLQELVARYRRYLIVLMVSFVVFYQLKYFSPQSIISVEDKDVLRPETIAFETSSLSYEYMLKGTLLKKQNNGDLVIDITKDQIGVNKSKIFPHGLIIHENYNSPNKFDISTNSTVNSQIIIPRQNFPEWRVEVDGNLVKTSDNNPFKLISLNIAPGKHLITGRLENTKLRKIANGISVFSIFVLLSYLFLARMRLNGKNTNKTPNN